MAIRLITLRPRRGISELTQPSGKCSLDRLGIGRCELVFEREDPLRPGGESLGINELLQLTDQLVAKVFRSVRWQTGLFCPRVVPGMPRR